MIRTRGLAVRYPGGPPIPLPDVDAAAGEAVAVVGPSGSGKTSLLGVLAGTLSPERGSATVAGVEVTALPEAQRRAFRAARVGWVAQDFALVGHLSVTENVLLPYFVAPGLSLTGEVRARAAGLVERLGLGAHRGRVAGRLSQGERQRVAVARALLTRPAVVLADEPTGNLDPAAKAVVLDALFGLCREVGSALLVVTHDYSLLDRFARVVDVSGTPS